MSDPTLVRFLEALPQPASGPPLQGLALRPHNLLAEEFRFLAAKVAALAEARFTTIGITSAGEGEGKTTLALGLAAALARSSNQRVLLLEADLRHPALEKYLGLPRTSGVSEWLAGSAEPVPVRHVSPSGFAFVGAGRLPLTEPERLGSERMSALLAACQLSYGFVIVDCPPLNPVADAVALQDLLDGFLLVVKARASPREALNQATSRLKEGRIQGVVFVEGRQLLPGGRRYGYGSFYQGGRERRAH